VESSVVLDICFINNSTTAHGVTVISFCLQKTPPLCWRNTMFSGVT